FRAIAEESLLPPRTVRQLAGYLDEHLSPHDESLCRPHAVQVLTDDDDLQYAYYFLDDHFLQRHPGRADFLLHEGWRLPAGHGSAPFRSAVPPVPLLPAGRGKGTTYLAFLAVYDTACLSEPFGPYRIGGIRLPDLCQYLREVEPASLPAASRP